MTRSGSNHHRPTVGVVTVAWNDLKGLEATVRSVEEQSFLPDEHVIIDGGSSDGSAEFLEGLPTVAWRQFVSEPDNGIYDAMNKGLRLIDADYVMFMNSGDRFIDRQALNDVTTILKDVRPAWAFGRSWIEWPNRPGFHDLGADGRTKFFLGRATVPHQSTIISRKLMDAIGPFRTDVGLSADQEHLVRAWLSAEPLYIDRAIATCDAAGVGSRHKPWALSVQMHRHRRANRVPLYSNAVISAAVLAAGATESVLRATARRVLGRSK